MIKTGILDYISPMIDCGKAKKEYVECKRGVKSLLDVTRQKTKL